MSPVRIGQVGVGYWGSNLLRNFRDLDEAELVAVCDQKEDVLEKLSGEQSRFAVTDRYEDLLESDRVEAIVVATQTPHHFDMARAALEAGKHVFVEKPLAETAAEAKTLVRLARERDLRLMVGHLLLYHPAFRFVEDRIRDGDLGEVYYLYTMRVNLGIVRQRENALQSLGPHDLSVALQFLESRPVSVSAQGQSFLQEQIEDVAFATVYFENGRMAHLHTSWLDPHKIRKITVVGSQQMAVIDDMESTEKVRLYDKGIDPPVDDPVDYRTFAEAMSIRMGDVTIPSIDMQEPLRLECVHFLECVQQGRSPRTDGENGLVVVGMLEAAQESLRQKGRTVEIPSMAL